MKVLIWIGCMFVATLLNTMLGYLVGFKAGTFVVYLIVAYFANKLCKKWDEHKEEKSQSVEEKTNKIAWDKEKQLSFQKKLND